MTIPARPEWFEIQMRGHPEAARAEEWARRCRSDYERDDIASEAMLRGLRARAIRLEGKLPTPPPSVPKRSLIGALLECGFVDGRGEGRERERLARLETDLQQAVRDINGNVIKLNPKN